MADDEDDLDHKPQFRYGYRQDEFYLPDENQVDIIKVAKRRFDFREEDMVAMPQDPVALT